MNNYWSSVIRCKTQITGKIKLLWHCSINANNNTMMIMIMLIVCYRSRWSIRSSWIKSNSWKYNNYWIPSNTLKVIWINWYHRMHISSRKLILYAWRTNTTSRIIIYVMIVMIIMLLIPLLMIRLPHLLVKISRSSILLHLLVVSPSSIIRGVMLYHRFMIKIIIAIMLIMLIIVLVIGTMV